jgi:hypothetical protein
MQFEGTHKYDDNKSNQQENEYHRVDYRQPMNLQKNHKLLMTALIMEFLQMKQLFGSLQQL